VQDAINELHFHPKWFEYELLPLDFFTQQVQKYRRVQQYHQEDDSFWQNPDPQVDEEMFWASLEHHRYFAFQTILSSCESLTDDQVEHYVELCQLDEDTTMARSALINLLRWPYLHDEQYQKLTQHPALAHPVTEKIIWRNQMYAELQSNIIPDEIFSEILERQDPVFERELVLCASISREQLQVLVEKGISRAVRNIAKNKLGRRR
jgi:hypothetical protein